ncbi:sodium/hydrogen exchanger 10-like isoform X2 [Hypanus sabinus]|uniref:sodium/hydrogen exchanger 10-like isoform X2 n=1 Tax=Hypanus sabinus TaxID=79690 RepID=UPI0028C38A64|nr:sodium/hydrogen exchanger 10-like isoform X2 [Hypanus sabinus]
MKRLLKFPSSIQPPTAEELLKNLPWLHNAEKRIEFIKYRAKLLYFDYGDVVVHQGEQPRGIHLIVSGMVKLHGVKPSLGTSSKGLDTDDDEDEDDYLTDKAKPTFTDYRSSGAIIGELNCLTQQRMEVTVTCETVAQDWTYNSVCAYLVRSYIVDIEKNNKFDLYDGTVEDAFLVYGSAEDVQSQKQYDAPCYISKTTHQVLGLANINKVLVVGAGVKDLEECRSGPCLHQIQPHTSGTHFGDTFSGSQMELYNMDSSSNKLTTQASMMFRTLSPRLEGGRLQTATSIANVKKIY